MSTTTRRTLLRRAVGLGSLAALALLVVIFRAWNQDLTIDEANTYHYFIAPLSDGFWSGHSNNHLLSTLMMKASVAVFGVSPFTLRLPAMASAAMLLLAAALLVARLTWRESLATSLILFVLLIGSPFIMDYLVAARGYAPALACQMAMLALLARDLEDPSPLEQHGRRWVALSVIGALGVSSNYVFVFTLTSILAMRFIIAVVDARNESKPIGGAAAWAALRLFGPFGIVLTLVAASNLRSIDPSDMKGAWGTTAWRRIFSSMAEMAFVPANPFLSPPHLRPLFGLLARIAPWISLALLLLAIIFIAWRQRPSSGMTIVDGRLGAADRFAAATLGALVLSVAMHTALFLLRDVKMPMTRTAIHFVPLIVLVATAPLYLAPRRPLLPGPFLRAVYVACAGCIASLFVFSQHFSYFQEWKWGADACKATDTALAHAKRLGVEKVHASWEVHAAGNFYGEYLGYGADRLVVLEEPLLPEAAALSEGAPVVLILSRRMWETLSLPEFGVAYESRVSGTRVMVRNVQKDHLPESAVQMRLDPAGRCHDHHWYRDADVYPGAKWYW